MARNNVAKKKHKQHLEEQRQLQLEKAVQIARAYKSQFEMISAAVRELHSGTLLHEMIYDLTLFTVRTVKRGDRSVVDKIDPDPGKNDFIYTNIDRYEHTCRRLFWELLTRIQHKYFYELIRGMCEHEAFIVRDNYIKAMEDHCRKTDQKCQELTMELNNPEYRRSE